MFGEPSLDAPEGIDLVEKPLQGAVQRDYSEVFTVGTLVRGRYEVLRYLGSGSVSSVLVARHIGFAEQVALKFLQPQYFASAATAGRFLREARAGFKLRSEHIARVYDVDVHEDAPFIVTEHFEGLSLRAVLEQPAQLAVETAVDYMLQVCEALACAHVLGIVHRNLKPENLFLRGDEHIKVVDFGISKLALGVGEGRSGRVAVAAPLYLAPEQVRAGLQADVRSDIWSVGCVLYELLTGRSPFDRGGLMQTCAAVLEQDPEPLSGQRDHLPDALCSVVARCLQKQPAARFADVAELAAALLPFGSGRYSSYPERCRARLNAERSGHGSPTPLNDGTSAVARCRNINVTGALPVTSRLVGAPAAAMQRSGHNTVLGLGLAAADVASAAEAPIAPVEASPIKRRAQLRVSSMALMAALLCMLWGGVVLFVRVEREPPRSPQLLHLVTPRQELSSP